MINADNIGKRIKMLRKQKKVSQERMAEDLGMYQADISNLERAMGGSGINDMFKLDMIADYFGISLIELLMGFSDETAASVSENKNPEEYQMKDYVITKARRGGKFATFVSEVTLTAPNNEVTYVSFYDYDDVPRFYQTKNSIFDKLMDNDTDDPKTEKELSRFCFLSGEDYIDIFNKVDEQWLSVCRYLIFIATEDDESAEELIKETEGKAIKDILVPIPTKEPEDLFYVNYSDLSVVYRYRLMVETSLKNPSVFSDMDDTVKREEAILEKLKAACGSEEAYKVWKKDLVDAKMKEVMEKEHIVAVSYLFAGMGQYKEIMPLEEVESFKCWIDHCGAGFFGGYRDATKREIRSYVSKHIGDELLGMQQM